MNENKLERVGIIGAGWYGSHVAIALRKQGYEVSIFEKNPRIFGKISGKFGVRLHAGPHYPRSPATRKGCHEGYMEFCKRYPDLIKWHEYAIYGLGIRDANNEPSKVNTEQFLSVCREFKSREEIKPEKWGYRNLFAASNLDEPSLPVGNEIRKSFKKLLRNAGVKIFYNFTVSRIEKKKDNILVFGDRQQSYQFNHLINATSYQSLLPIEKLPFSIEVVYQPCLALMYIDTKKPKQEKPFSFIVMDGWFPCVMPYLDGEENNPESPRKYILTHGKWTILGSYKTASEAEFYLSLIDDGFVKKHIKPYCEAEIIKFWPEFDKRFQYVRWVGDVLAKIKTDREFRSAITFQDRKSGVIYIIPGKVSNIFDVEREITALIKKENILNSGNYLYVKNGILHDGSREIADKPKDVRNTCELQPYAKYFSTYKKDAKFITKSGFFSSTMRSEKGYSSKEEKNVKPRNTITMSQYKKITGLDVVVSSNFGVVVPDDQEENHSPKKS